MQVSVTDAKAQLTDLVRRAEAGDDIVLTRHGHPAVRLVALAAPPVREDRRAKLMAIASRAAAKALPGGSAALSQQELYDEHGLPA